MFNATKLPFQMDRKRYPFSIKLNESGAAYFEIPLNSGIRFVPLFIFHHMNVSLSITCDTSVTGREV